MRLLKFFLLGVLCFPVYGALDQAANFAKVNLSGPYNSAATTLVLSSGQGAKLPASTPYNLVWYNATDYPDPSDDPNVEIIRVTNRATDTLTVTRAQESTAASNHNIQGRQYKLIRSLTAKEFNTDIPALDSSWTSGSGGALTLSGPTVSRVATAPDANFSFARIDAGQTFTGVNTMTSPSLLGTVSVADVTTPAIQLETGKANTGTITVKGKTSGSLIITTADATAQNLTFNVAAQTTGNATVSVADMGGTSRTFVTGPSAGALSFTGSTAARIKTIRDAADTILELGGSYTPTGTWTSMTLVTPALGTPASGLLSNCTFPACTTSIPNLNLPSGTVRTTPAAGDIEFDGVNLYSTMDTSSSRGQLPCEQYFHLTANGGAITSIANFFGSTSNINIVANAYYVIDIYFWYVSTGTGAVTFTFTNSAAPTSQNIFWEMSPTTGVVAPPGTATMLVGQILNDATSARTIVTGSLSAATHYAHAKFWLKNGTGTTFKIQATSAATNLTPQINSFWFCRRLSPNNIGAFNN